MLIKEKFNHILSSGFCRKMKKGLKSKWSKSSSSANRTGNLYQLRSQAYVQCDLLNAIATCSPWQYSLANTIYSKMWFIWRYSLANCRYNINSIGNSTNSWQTSTPGAFCTIYPTDKARVCQRLQESKDMPAQVMAAGRVCEEIGKKSGWERSIVENIVEEKRRKGKDEG